MNATTPAAAAISRAAFKIFFIISLLTYSGYHLKMPKAVFTALRSMALITVYTRVLLNKTKYAAAYF